MLRLALSWWNTPAYPPTLIFDIGDVLFTLSPTSIEESLERYLRNLLGDPVARGREYLQRNSRLLHSITDTPSPIILRENFAKLLILELANDKGLVEIEEHPRLWNFFRAGKGTLTTEVFPYDLDTTSIGLTIMARDEETVNSVMDEMLEYVDSDGIILTYFDHQRPRRLR
ncbi:hypothetical protein FB45DRAFT_1051809 [Roridomyces roridus]|uniref:Uncharacterized protein n=1 Tax=Roridomyces roridus TaxID=1738132 RepID=A0AAD7CF55_9AGAR|nr:hypothetical protein FB45DRAFT_1051809 [Roridomyces roridus]